MEFPKSNYMPLIPPVSKPIRELTPKEAAVFFEWFMSYVDIRSDYVWQQMSEQMPASNTHIKYSIKSLIPIWQWFLSVAEITTTPEHVLNSLRQELRASGKPESFVEIVVGDHKKELSVVSKYILRDIGMYLGEVLVKNFNSLRWDYHCQKRKDSFVNSPQIFGFVDNSFSPPFEKQYDPIFYTEMQASKLLRNLHTETDLYDMCAQWIQWIP